MIPYSKKVLKHFSNPKYFGRFKNPDAKGEVGNVRCVLPNTKICANPRMKAIDNVKKGDKVLTHTGEYYQVSRTYRNKYKGELASLKTKLGVTTVTSDHHIFAVKLPKTHKFYYTKNKKQLANKPFWHHAGELEKRDILPYSLLSEVKDTKELSINIPKLFWDHTSQDIPGSVKIDKDFLRFIGYFLAEGSIILEKCRTHIRLCFGINEKKYVGDAVYLIKKIFNINAKTKEEKHHNTITVFLHSARVARFFYELFGKGAKAKKLPHFIMLLPTEKQKGLIRGLWRGDGYFNISKPRAGYSTISYQLCQQIKTLLLRQKIAPSIYTEEEKITSGVKHEKAYRIHVGDRSSLIKLAKILEIPFSAPNTEEKIHSWFDDKYFYTPITNVSKSVYNGIVHNLEVKKTKSYLTESAILHNCGDLMTIYLKIEKVKGKDRIKDKIKDIRFETLGCAAAIATSDMICDLAKGKTLDRALKVSFNDIAKNLGELPPVKMHCAVLATDGLKAAVEDYKSHNV